MVHMLLFWAAAIYLLEKIKYRSRAAEKAIQGEPKVIIQNGSVVRSVMEEEEMTMKDLETLLRHDGVWNIKDVELGVLEISGKINCKRKEN
jgi:uncharacterized membrane protein YcaP (DUF421 family)